MRVLSSGQIKSADQLTISNDSISSVELMERAAEKCCSFFPTEDEWEYLVVVCGTGNNGGDGLAIARLLSGNYRSVRVLIIDSGKKHSDEFEINLKRWQEMDGKTQIIKNSSEIFITPDELVADAILGIGLNRPAEGLIADCIDVINSQASFIISIDLPSGLQASSASIGKIIEADLTLTIGAPKPVLFSRNLKNIRENVSWLRSTMKK
jgi:NAD(P)H-hydrate epimerase